MAQGGPRAAALPKTEPQDKRFFAIKLATELGSIDSHCTQRETERPFARSSLEMSSNESKFTPTFPSASSPETAIAAPIVIGSATPSESGRSRSTAQSRQQRKAKMLKMKADLLKAKRREAQLEREEMQMALEAAEAEEDDAVSQALSINTLPTPVGIDADDNTTVLSANTAPPRLNALGTMVGGDGDLILTTDGWQPSDGQPSQHGDLSGEIRPSPTQAASSFRPVREKSLSPRSNPVSDFLSFQEVTDRKGTVRALVQRLEDWKRGDILKARRKNSRPRQVCWTCLL